MIRKCFDLLFKGKLDEDKKFLENLDFWMQSVYAFTPGSEEEKIQGQQEQLSPPILIVGTHRDSLSTTPDKRKEMVSFSINLPFGTGVLLPAIVQLLVVRL